jgi:hypothetical protein
MVGSAEGRRSRAAGERLIARHLGEAHERVRGEIQLADHVASLVSVVALRDECRVEVDEKRSLEEVIRAWTHHLLSGLEGG